MMCISIHKKKVTDSGGGVATGYASRMREYLFTNANLPCKAHDPSEAI